MEMELKDIMIHDETTDSHLLESKMTDILDRFQ